MRQSAWRLSTSDCVLGKNFLLSLWVLPSLGKELIPPSPLGRNKGVNTYSAVCCKFSHLTMLTIIMDIMGKSQRLQLLLQNFLVTNKPCNLLSQILRSQQRCPLVFCRTITNLFKVGKCCVPVNSANQLSSYQEHKSTLTPLHCLSWLGKLKLVLIGTYKSFNIPYLLPKSTWSGGGTFKLGNAKRFTELWAWKPAI